MRLIDLDKALIEAEDECRMSDDWKVSHEMMNVFKYQPTVKAIPLELIEKEMKRLDEDIKWAWYYGNTAIDKMEYLKTWLTIKLEDWEKEHGK